MIKTWQMFLESHTQYRGYPNATYEEEVAAICKRYGIVRWTINPDTDLVDVNSNVDLSYRNLTKIPLSFGKITGIFTCEHNLLISLEGSPKEVGRDFHCNNNNLTSLEGCPSIIGGNFICSNNNLISLEGSPKEVGGYFYCDNNLLISLNGCPSKVGEIFHCDNNRIISLEGLGQAFAFAGYHNMINNLTEIGKTMINNKISFIESVMLNIKKISDDELLLIIETLDPQKILDLNNFKIFNLLRTNFQKKICRSLCFTRC